MVTAQLQIKPKSSMLPPQARQRVPRPYYCIQKTLFTEQGKAFVREFSILMRSRFIGAFVNRTDTMPLTRIEGKAALKRRCYTFVPT
jgi:hypothetical protein